MNSNSLALIHLQVLGLEHHILSLGFGTIALDNTGFYKHTRYV